MVRIEDLKLTLAPIEAGSTVTVLWNKYHLTAHQQTFTVEQLRAAMTHDGEEPINTDTDSNLFGHRLSMSDPGVIEFLAAARNDDARGDVEDFDRTVATWFVHAPGTEPPTVDDTDDETQTNGHDHWEALWREYEELTDFVQVEVAATAITCIREWWVLKVPTNLWNERDTDLEPFQEWITEHYDHHGECVDEKNIGDETDREFERVVGLYERGGLTDTAHTVPGDEVREPVKDA